MEFCGVLYLYISGIVPGILSVLGWYINVVCQIKEKRVEDCGGEGTSQH